LTFSWANRLATREAKVEVPPHAARRAGHGAHREASWNATEATLVHLSPDQGLRCARRRHMRRWLGLRGSHGNRPSEATSTSRDPTGSSAHRSTAAEATKSSSSRRPIRAAATLLAPSQSPANNSDRKCRRR